MGAREGMAEKNGGRGEARALSRWEIPGPGVGRLALAKLQIRRAIIP